MRVPLSSVGLLSLSFSPRNCVPVSLRRARAMAVAFWSALVFCAATSGCTADSGLVDCDPGYRDCVCSGGVCVDGLICSDNVCIPSILDPTPNSSSVNDGPNPDAFFADDPPPMVCLPDGTMGPPPEIPGGTPECPDDKNREGCPCTNLGQQAACWPLNFQPQQRGFSTGTLNLGQHCPFSTGRLNSPLY